MIRLKALSVIVRITGTAVLWPSCRFRRLDKLRENLGRLSLAFEVIRVKAGRLREGCGNDVL